MKFRSIITILSVCLIGINSLFAQQNIALTADGISTSHVSPWEDLYAINEGTDPESSMDKAGGAYGNWENGGNADWDWVEYNWNSPMNIYQSDVYWWTDGGGIQIPYDTYLEYWDVINEVWLPLPNVFGNGILADQYNVTTFDTVLTNKIRVNCISTIGTGILEWKVWGSEGEQVPLASTISIDAPLSKGGTTSVTLSATENGGAAVSGYVFKLDVQIIDEMSDNLENYSIAGDGYSDFSGIISLPATDVDGVVTFDVACPATIDPKDGIELRVLFNAGTLQLGDTLNYTEPGLTPPVLNADVTDNDVDHSIAIAFTDDAAWRAAIQTVLVNGSPLAEGVDFEILTGQIVFEPSGGNSILTQVGEKLIVVEATGYEDTEVEQSLLAGAVDDSVTSIEPVLGLYKYTTTQIQAKVADQFGNPIEAYSIVYDVTIISNDATTSEVYNLAGTDVGSSQAGFEMPATDENGIAAISISIPGDIDSDDGIYIQFKTQEFENLDLISYVNDGSEKEIVVQNALKNNPDFSFGNSAQSENFVVFWGNKITGNPTDAANGSLKFDPNNILEIMESLLYYMTDSMGFIDNANESNMARYKHEIVMNETWTNNDFTGYAFGGSIDDKIGGMWIHPSATGGSAVLAHEFTHMCQAMVLLQYPGYGLKTDYAGFFWESHANYYSAQYSNTYTGVQIERYINTAMLHFSTTRHYYQNLYFIDHVRDKYGLDTTHLIWRNASPTRSHPLTSFRDSVMRYSQDDLNDDLFETARKNVTWDYGNKNLIRKAYKSIQQMYIGREYTILNEISGQEGTYVVPGHLAPGDYGYNIIPIYPDDMATEIVLSFTGYDNEPAGGAGWRYGFVSVQNNGFPRYGNINSAQEADITFALESSDSLVYLVVLGAPDTHHNYGWVTGFPKEYRYPYSIQLEGALPAGYKEGYNSQKDNVAGAPHPNGGGWIASTATVDETVYVGPNAQVLGNATLTGNVRVEDYAIITDNANVSGSAIIRDHSIVGNSSNVSEYAIVEKAARVYGTSLKDNVVITGSAMLFFSTISGEAIIKDLAYLYNSTLSGTVVVGGDAEDYSGCSKGTYLQMQTVRTTGCDGRTNISMNKDINPDWEVYHYPSGSKPTTPLNLTGNITGSGEVTLNWDASESIQESLAYYVLQDGRVVFTSETNTTTINELEDGETYSFIVQALGEDGKLSDMSNEVLITLTSTGITDHKENFVDIFPNPTSGKVTFQFNTEYSVILKIMDLSGKIILENEFENSITLEKESIGNSGLYLIETKIGDEVYFDKLVIQ